MDRIQLGAGGTTLGAGTLATCVCTTSQLTLGGVALGGAVIALNLHTALFTLAAGLVLAGLASRSPAAAFRAAGGFALMVGGYLLAPPAVMSRDAIHTHANLLGFGLTVMGIGAVVWGVLTAYPTRNPKAATVAAGGLGAAAGCSCCMATGALTWLAAAIGYSVPLSPFSDGVPFALFMAIAAGGLYALAGRRYALIALAGAAVAFAGDEVLKALPSDIETLPRLLTAFAGTMVVFYAFARGFQAARRTVNEEAVAEVEEASAALA